MSDFLISQLLALATLVCGMAAFQFRQRVLILRLWCVAAIFGAAHFWFLGAVEASMLVGVTALRFFVSSLTIDRRMLYLFLALAVGGFAWTYQSPVSVLALAATLVGTYGSFHGSDNAVRYSMIAAEVFWLVHNIIVWSPVAIFMEVLFFSSNVIGLVRHRKASETAL
jgi:hypothetical protein